MFIIELSIPARENLQGAGRRFPGLSREEPSPQVLNTLKSALTASYTFLAFARTTTQMSASATDATAGGHQRQEDGVALLARFVRHVSVVRWHLSVAGASQMHSRTALRNYGETRRGDYPSTPGPDTLGVPCVNVALSQAHRHPQRGNLSASRKRRSTDRSVSLLSSSAGHVQTESTLSHIGWRRPSQTGNPRKLRLTQRQTFGPSTRESLMSMTTRWSRIILRNWTTPCFL